MINHRLLRFKRLAKEGSWIAVGQIMSVIASLALVRVLTEHLDPTQYGQLALGLTVSGLVNQVVMGGISNGISRFYSIAAEKQDLNDYLYATRRLMLYATIVIIAISLLLISGLLWLGYKQWVALVVAALVFSVLSAYNTTLSSIQNAARQRSIVAFHNSLEAWLKIGLALGVMLWLGKSSVAVVISYACASLLITFSQLVFLRRTIPVQKEYPTKNHHWKVQIWTYSFPFMTWGIFSWAQQSSARWALETFGTTSDVGLYSVLSQLGYTPIQIATSLAITLISPIIFARAGDASCPVRTENIRKLTNKLVILGLSLTGCAFMLTCLLHSYIFDILVSKKYLSVSHYLPLLVLSGGIFSVAQIYASRIMSLMQTKAMISASIGSSIIGVISSYVGVYYFSVQGAVVSILLHAVSYFIWILITSNKINIKSSSISERL